MAGGDGPAIPFPSPLVGEGGARGTVIPFRGRTWPTVGDAVRILATAETGLAIRRHAGGKLLVARDRDGARLWLWPVELAVTIAGARPPAAPDAPEPAA